MPFPIIDLATTLINFRRACAARVAVVAACVCPLNAEVENKCTHSKRTTESGRTPLLHSMFGF